MSDTVITHVQHYIEVIKAHMPSSDEIRAEPDDSREANMREQRNTAVKEMALRKCPRENEQTRVDIDTGRPWVIDVTRNYDDNEVKPKVEVKPVDVDRTLNEQPWYRTNKRVLSSASVPYPDDPERWAEELGLKPEDVYYISAVPCCSRGEHRPVYLNTTIDRFSGSGFLDNIEAINAKSSMRTTNIP